MPLFVHWAARPSRYVPNGVPTGIDQAEHFSESKTIQPQNLRQVVWAPSLARRTYLFVLKFQQHPEPVRSREMPRGNAASRAKGDG